MRKKKFPLSFLIIAIFTILVALAIWDVLEFRKEKGAPEEISEIPSKEKPEKVSEECSPIDFPGYELATINGNPLEFKVDLNGDQKEETIRVYNQISESGFRSLPINLKIFSGEKDCLKEEFSYMGEDPARDIKENEVFDFQIFSNFWGDGREVIMLIGQQTGYGPGYTLYLHFFAFQNEKYQKIEGPELSSLSTFKFKDAKLKGKEIIVAHGIWAEGEAHYDYHRYQFEIYTFDGEKYIKKEAGITQEKYFGDIDEMLKREPEALNAP